MIYKKQTTESRSLDTGVPEATRIFFSNQCDSILGGRLRSIALIIRRRVISPDQTNTVVEFSKPIGGRGGDIMPLVLKR
jgi:hypothetical protein